MLIHQQNWYVPRGKQCTGHHAVQSRDPVNKVKKDSLYKITENRLHINDTHTDVYNSIFKTL
jgi:hypothetical protein